MGDIIYLFPKISQLDKEKCLLALLCILAMIKMVELSLRFAELSLGNRELSVVLKARSLNELLTQGAAPRKVTCTE